MFKLRKPIRQSNSAVVYIAVSVLLIVLLTIFGLSFFTRADVIEVNGIVKYTAQEVIEASGLYIGDNLITLDTDNAEMRIQTLLPHISEVNITAVFPNRIRIDVVESSPIATLRHRTGILIVDSGVRVVEILSQDSAATAGLIEIRGFTPTGAELGSRVRVELGNQSQLRHLEELLRVIEEEGLFRYITYIDISSIVNITFDYTDRFRIILDSPTNIAHHVGALRDTISDAERDGIIQPGASGTISFDDTEGVVRFGEGR